MIYDNLGILLGATIATLTPYITSWIKKRIKHDNFLPNLDIRKEIKIEIEKLLVETDANRISIVEFSNTDVSINGLPFNYASMTYEATDNNTKDLIPSFQKIPISPYADMLLSLEGTREQYLCFTDRDSNSAISMVHKYYGQKTIYLFKITNSIRDGVIRLEYTNSYPTFTAEEIDKIKLYIMKLKFLKSQIKKH